jgi:hypothetical protein
MSTWTGIALARAAPGEDGMQSRLSTYLHPLAGRPLAWHTLAAIAGYRPARLVLVANPQLSPEQFLEVGLPLDFRYLDGVPAAHEMDGDFVVLVDAAAAACAPALARLVAAGGSAAASAGGEGVCAARLTPDEAARFLDTGEELSAVNRVVPGLEVLDAGTECLVVSDRAALARVSRLVRDRVVRRLMDGGVTFLLPDSVLVDVDVRMGRDTVVYPGVVIEGETVVGEETVIGPGCRIVDSWIGSGVELKGWNFISRSSVRNRAILEPHVRRGFD